MSNISKGDIMNHFELDDDDIYRSTQVFEELFKLGFCHFSSNPLFFPNNRYKRLISQKFIF